MAVKYPHLLVFEEKHGNRYFHITCGEDYHDALTQMFKERVENNWYDYPEPKPFEHLIEIPEGLDPDGVAAIEKINEDRSKFNKKQMRKYDDLNLFNQAKDGNYAAIEDIMYSHRGSGYNYYHEETYEDI